MLNTILVAIDNSTTSQWAFDTALTLAKALKAELLLVHALDVFAPDSPQHLSTPADSATQEINTIVHKDYLQQWKTLVERYSGLLKQKQDQAEVAGVLARPLQPYGSPGPAICHTAMDNNVDLIVIGNRDHTQLQELMIGSVGNYVLHHAPCSVTIVHSDQRHRAVVQPALQKEKTSDFVSVDGIKMAF